MRSKASHWLAACWLTGSMAVWSVSHAALFDDNEARKRILEVEAKSTADHEAQQSAISELNKTQRALDKRVQSLESLLNSKGLLEMQNQVELLKQEIAQLKGDLEVITHQLESMQAKEKELYLDIDTRLRRLEEQKSGAVVPADAVAASTVITESKPLELTKSMDTLQQEQRAYAEADGYNQAARFKEAFTAFDGFLRSYPNSKLAPEALYGLGYAQYGLKNYKSSIATMQKFVDANAAHALAPQALMSIANSQIQLAQVAPAKKTLRQLIDQFPNADVIPTAQKRLKMLESLR